MMSRRRLFWMSYAVGFALAGAIAVFAISMLNNLAPQQVNWQALQLTDLQGRPVALSKYNNKLVLVNVWATWCKRCLEEMPALDRLQQLHPDKLAIVAVSDEDPEKLRQFADLHKYSFGFLRASAPLSSQHLTLFPITYVLGPDGQVKAIYLGKQQWDSPRLQQKLLPTD